MSKETALKRAHSLFPLGTKVEWSGIFGGKQESGKGEVVGYISSPQKIGYVYIDVRPVGGGQRRFIVADPDEKDGAFNYADNLKIIQ